MADDNPYTQKSLSEKILDRQVQFEAIREPLDEKFAEIIDLTQPGYTAWESSSSAYGSSYGGGVWDDGVAGKFRGQRIFESTPAWGLRVMADGWLGSTVAETLRWFKYLFPDAELRGDDEVNAWMQKLEDAMYAVYRKSQLYEALSPYALGAFSVGSPIILPWDDTKEDRISCEVPHPKENFHGPYDAYHRKYKIDVITAVNMFMDGKVPDDIENQKLSFNLLDNWRNGRHAKRHEFIRAIYRQDDPILDDQPAKMKNKPWMEFYIETPKSGATALQMEKDPVRTGGYFTKPHIRWDYEINTDEYYARTPSFNAIQDIRSFEEYERQKMEAGQRAMKPPMYMLRKFRNQWTGNPGSMVLYDPGDEQYEPKAINDGTNWQVGDEQSQQMRRSVERWYNTSFFLQLSELTASNTGSWPTATQILQLAGEKAAILGPRVGRFTNVMRQIDRRFFDIELRKGVHGALPAPPPVVEDYLAEQAELGKKNISLTVEMIGPLAVIQQRAETLGRSAEGMEIIGNYLQMDPLLIHKVRLDVQMEKDLEAVRFSQDAIVPEDEYQETMAALAEAEAEQKELEQGLALAAASKDVSGPVDDSSIIAKIGEQAA